MDLEKALQETIEEFKKRIEQNPRLKLLDYTANIPKKLQRKNCFEMQNDLVQSLKQAYREENLAELEKLPNCYGWLGDNSITYQFMLGEQDQNQPFRNETSGENVSWVITIFKNLAHAGQPLYFYSRLQKIIKQFEKERDRVRDEILATPAYKTTKQIADLTKDPERIQDLRLTYRKEELKRKGTVLELCEKAEFIYELASRLFEGLKDA